MKIEVSKQDLAQAIKFVSATAKAGDDLSGHYLFRLAPDSTDMVEVLTSNGKAASVARVNCKYTPTEGGATAFMFSVSRMDTWLSACPDAALALEHANGVTVAYSPLGEQKFESFDHSQFPLFDGIRAESKVTAKVQADRLRAALKYARPFVYADETKKPNICQIAFRDGILHATDTATALAIKMPGFEEANFSLSSKGIANLLTFLSSCGDGEIEVREHDRMTLFCSGDTAMFGEAPMHHQFPKLALGLDQPNQKVWKLDRKEVKLITTFLLSAAPVNNEFLIFSDSNDPAQVKMGMAVAAGGTKHIPLACAEKVTNVEVALPEKGFKVRHPNLQKVLDASEADTIVVGVNAKGTGGWLRFDEEINGDKYYAIVQWSV